MDSDLFIVIREIKIKRTAQTVRNKTGIQIKLLIQIPRLRKTASHAKGYFIP